MIEGIEVKIVNNASEEMNVTYTSDGYINCIKFPLEKVEININYGTSDVSILTYKYNENNQKELVEGTKLTFSNNIITKVEDQLTNYYIKPTYNSNNKVVKVSLFNDLSDEEAYNMNYTYNSSMTQVMDQNGYKQYYYFDKYGMVKTILDEKGYAQTFNYGEVVKGQVQKLTGNTLLQTNLRNPIENSSFEISKDASGELYGWNVDGDHLDFEIVEEGMASDKCIKLNRYHNIYFFLEL